MTTYSYIDGVLKENPTMPFPNINDYVMVGSTNDDTYNADIRRYREQESSMKTYIAPNFPSSYVGRNDLELNKHFLLQHQCFCIKDNAWENVSKEIYDWVHYDIIDKTQVRRIIAIHIEEKDHIPDSTKMIEDDYHKWDYRDWLNFVSWYSGMNEKSILDGINQYQHIN